MAEIKAGTTWTRMGSEEQVAVLGFGESINGVPIVRYMGNNHRALAMSRDDFLAHYEPRRRTIYERLLDED